MAIQLEIEARRTIPEFLANYLDRAVDDINGRKPHEITTRQHGTVIAAPPSVRAAPVPPAPLPGSGVTAPSCRHNLVSLRLAARDTDNQVGRAVSGFGATCEKLIRNGTAEAVLGKRILLVNSTVGAAKGPISTLIVRYRLKSA